MAAIPRQLLFAMVAVATIWPTDVTIVITAVEEAKLDMPDIESDAFNHYLRGRNTGLGKSVSRRSESSDPPSSDGGVPVCRYNPIVCADVKSVFSLHLNSMINQITSQLHGYCNLFCHLGNWLCANRMKAGLGKSVSRRSESSDPPSFDGGVPVCRYNPLVCADVKSVVVWLVNFMIHRIHILLCPVAFRLIAMVVALFWLRIGKVQSMFSLYCQMKVTLRRFALLYLTCVVTALLMCSLAALPMFWPAVAIGKVAAERGRKALERQFFGMETSVVLRNQTIQFVTPLERKRLRRWVHIIRTKKKKLARKKAQLERKVRTASQGGFEMVRHALEQVVFDSVFSINLIVCAWHGSPTAVWGLLLQIGA
jgi:hypothetical protein